MRKMLMFVLIAAMLLLGGTVMAQDSTTLCGGLAEADCALLTESGTAMEALSSASFNFSLAVTADGAEPMSLSITGDGAFSYDAAVMSDMAEIDPTDLMAVLDAVKTGIASFNGDLSLNIALPPSAGMPFESIALELLLVEGNGYLNFGSIAPLLGGPETLTAMGLPTEWAGLDLVDTIEQVVAMMGPQLEEIQGQMGSMTESAMDPNELMAFAQYFTFTRAADTDGAAVFSGTLDFAGLVADPAFMSLLTAQMAAQGQEIPAEQMEAVGQMMQQMGDAFVITLTQRIDLETKFLRGVDFAMNVDGAALDSMGAGTGTPNVTIAASFNYADFNAAPAITAPDGAPVATFMQLIGLFGAMGQ